MRLLKYYFFTFIAVSFKFSLYRVVFVIYLFIYIPEDMSLILNWVEFALDL